jgi:hypothetical protein
MNSKLDSSGEENMHRPGFFLLLIVLIFFLSALACNLPGVDLPSLEWIFLSPQEMDQTETEASQQTEVATRELPYNQLATSIAVTSTAQYSAALTQSAALYNSYDHKPVIIYIDFPTTIPADGTKVRGTIKFTDPSKDIILVITRVLSATLKFSDAQWNPGNDLEYHPDYGLIQYWTWCEGNQLVTQRIALQDSAGNVSDPVDITFACK